MEAAVDVHVLGPLGRVRQRGDRLGRLPAGVQHRYQGCGRRGGGMRGHQLGVGCGRGGGTGELLAVQLPVVVHDQFGAGQRVRGGHGGGEAGQAAGSEQDPLGEDEDAEMPLRKAGVRGVTGTPPRKAGRTEPSR